MNSANFKKIFSYFCIFAVFSTAAHSETFCIEPDGSSLTHQINFFGSQDDSKVLPLGIVYSNWTQKTECFYQARFMNMGVDGVIARDVTAGGLIVKFKDLKGTYSEGGHGYYVMVPNDNSEMLVHVREHVYEFLPLKNPVTDRSYLGYLVINKDDTPGTDQAPNQYVTMSFNEKSEFDYNGGVYKTNFIKLVVETRDDSGKSHYDSVNIHLDNIADAVDYLEPGVYQFDKIAFSGQEVWLTTVKN